MIKPTADLQVLIAGLRLKNPVMTASGTFGYAGEFVDLVDLNRLGAIVVKGLSLEPSIGNPPPRIVETPCGMLNAIGLENPGADVFIKEKLPALQKIGVPLIISILGKTDEEFLQLAEKFQSEIIQGNDDEPGKNRYYNPHQHSKPKGVAVKEFFNH